MTRTREQNIITKISKRRKGFNFKTLESVIFLAVEIAREGREGRKIGTMFIVSDSDRVMRKSKSLILNPLGLHPAKVRHDDQHSNFQTAVVLEVANTIFWTSANLIFEFKRIFL